MPKRVIRLGIDYGTSFSKIVFRDYGAPGGEKAYVLVRNGSFRIPSAVGVTSSEFVFGTSPQDCNLGGITWHESVKMRVAGEAKQHYSPYCFGPLPGLPSGFTARDMAVLTAWFLISESERAIGQYFKDQPTDAVLGFSLGIPMSFYNDLQLRRIFLDIARAAWEISKGLMAGGEVTFKQARRVLDYAYEIIRESDEVPEDEVRSWVRTEAEAALWWPFQSPSVGEGPYAQIDIGAGTTNLSIFRIVSKPVDGKWIKERLAFFGADSPPMGMDAIDKALAKWQYDSDEICLSLRGQEKSLFKAKDALVASSDVLKSICKVYRDIITKAFATHLQSPAERDSWRRHKIFFIGGGSQIDEIVKELRRSPMPGNDRVIHDVIFQEQPSDLFMADKSNVSSNTLPHVAVAYGLSNLADDLPKAETPDDVPPMEAIDLSPKNYKPFYEKDEWL